MGKSRNTQGNKLFTILPVIPHSNFPNAISKERQERPSLGHGSWRCVGMCSFAEYLFTFPTRGVCLSHFGLIIG